MIDNDLSLRKNPNTAFRTLAAGEGGVLLHLESGEYYGLNDIGCRVWELIDGERTVPDVVDAIRSEVDQTPRPRWRTTSPDSSKTCASATCCSPNAVWVGAVSGSCFGFAPVSDLPFEYLQTATATPSRSASGRVGSTMPAAPWSTSGRRSPSGDRGRVCMRTPAPSGFGSKAAARSTSIHAFPAWFCPVGLESTVKREERLWGIPALLCFLGRSDHPLHAAAVEVDGETYPGCAGLCRKDDACGRLRRGRPSRALGGRVVLALLLAADAGTGPGDAPGSTRHRRRLEIPAPRRSPPETIDPLLTRSCERRRLHARPGSGICPASQHRARDSPRTCLSGRSLRELWPLSFRLPTLHDRERCFQSVTALADAIPVWNLYLPLRLDLLRIVQKIASDVNRPQLSIQEKLRLATRVWVQFALVSVRVRRQPLPRLVAHLASVNGSPRRPHAPATLARAVDRSLRVGSHRPPPCLINALVLFRLLKEQGDEGELVIGFRSGRRTNGTCLGGARRPRCRPAPGAGGPPRDGAPSVALQSQSSRQGMGRREILGPKIVQKLHLLSFELLAERPIVDPGDAVGGIRAPTPQRWIVEGHRLEPPVGVRLVPAVEDLVRNVSAQPVAHKTLHPVVGELDADREG